MYAAALERSSYRPNLIEFDIAVIDILEEGVGSAEVPRTDGYNGREGDISAYESESGESQPSRNFGVLLRRRVDSKRLCDSADINFPYRGLPQSFALLSRTTASNGLGDRRHNEGM